MKICKIITLLIVIISFQSSKLFGEEIKGEIISDDNNITIVKVWGTHEERGYATGYLLADKITDLYENFILPEFGSDLDFAKLIIDNPDHFIISQDYINEATAMVEGLKDAGFEDSSIDYRDILVANSFLDLANLNETNLNISNGCSSLISWGEATEGTELDGKSVITRHMDWNDMDVIIRNQTVVIHIPEETDEQPWLLIGFAGQMSVLSGINSEGLAVMQHMLADEYSSGTLNKAYEPIWFTLRKIIESTDYNNDGVNNAKDIRDAINSNINGYAESYIVAGMSKSNSENDSLIAIISELAPVEPHISNRYSTYPDEIPGDNIYAANFSISRNDALNTCIRYDAIKENISDGNEIDANVSWDLMLNHSSTCAFGVTGNIQFMQYIPEDAILKLAIHQNDGTQACESNSFILSTDSLFDNSSETNIVYNNHLNEFEIYPNPAGNKSQISIKDNFIGEKTIMIFSLDGRLIKKEKIQNNKFEIANMQSGLYILQVYNNDKLIGRKKLIIM
ncbi:MAG: T9SS type A sorting domain-containing protein [Bacteroidales bacterium]